MNNIGRSGKKKKVLEALFKYCQKRRNFRFNNELAKKLCAGYHFKNHFDLTKLDNTSQIPDLMRSQDYFIIHLGKGEHQFVKGITKGYHSFENIAKKDIVAWKYRKSILNEVDTSEGKVISVGFNQGIISDFLYGDPNVKPKQYSAHRTKRTLNYYLNGTLIRTNKVQMEIDATTEKNGHVTLFECKNNFPEDFAIYQIFMPYVYHTSLKKEENISIKKLTCCYMLRSFENGNPVIRMYHYTFKTANELTSIKLLKSRQYNLIRT